MSNIQGYLYDENGLDVYKIKEISDRTINVIDEYKKLHPNVITGENKHDIWKIKCDIALPCATQNEINLEDAKELVKNGCKILAEGANMPTELDAIKYLMKNGVIFSPGKASNAGGVAVSGLEMTQNAEHISWTFDEVEGKLKEIMKSIFNLCYETAKEFGEPENLSLGANVAGFLKVKDAMIREGLV